MRNISFFLFFIFMGCTPKIVEEDLKNLNGYWEIEKVTFPNGETKDYSVSTTIDYIELKDGGGFRKKVQPRFNGTFETSNDAEFLKWCNTKMVLNSAITMPITNGKKNYSLFPMIDSQ